LAASLTVFDRLASDDVRLRRNGVYPFWATNPEWDNLIPAILRTVEKKRRKEAQLPSVFYHANLLD